MRIGLACPEFHAVQGLYICSRCGGLAGLTAPGEQTCRCSSSSVAIWPRYDFNTAAELCRCCGQVLLRSGSRFSVWFCDGCKDEVRLLNGRLGRYAVPIGRHSLHGGFGPTGREIEENPVQVEVFVTSFRHMTHAMDAVRDWAGVVVQRILAERWSVVPERVPMAEYLGRCVETEEERGRCFRNMMVFLSTWQRSDTRSPPSAGR